MVEAETKGDNSVTFLVVGVVLVLVGVAAVAKDEIGAGILLLLAGLASIVFALRPSEAWTRRHKQITRLERKISEQRKIADS